MRDIKDDYANRLYELHKSIETEQTRISAEAENEHDLEKIQIYMDELMFIDKLCGHFIDLCIIADKMESSKVEAK